MAERGTPGPASGRGSKGCFARSWPAASSSCAARRCTRAWPGRTSCVAPEPRVPASVAGTPPHAARSVQDRRRAHAVCLHAAARVIATHALSITRVELVDDDALRGDSAPRPRRGCPARVVGASRRTRPRCLTGGRSGECPPRPV